MLPLLPEYVSLGGDGYYKAGEVSPWKPFLKNENGQLKARIEKLEGK